ncbi:SEC7-like domain containing protein [Rhodotorula toruloides NP11]|uniref:SEC7-like domain containing protein n=1 Tax=Rhodotorula toruloides (strain NP11) TaxID=1130832 RepID=M7XUM2_RHOT1|nr:SEC7-like domain containing protein [Rhodotorula toruloides NP11]EMS23943.1 SEC7-like domain containing protein [Rhodotorula toruloides NP11]
MLQAAAQRLTRSSPSQPASSPPLEPTTERQQRRLSRISPSEFDSVLTSGETVKLNTGTGGLASDSPEVLAPPEPSPSPETPRTKVSSRRGSSKGIGAFAVNGLPGRGQILSAGSSPESVRSVRRRRDDDAVEVLDSYQWPEAGTSTQKQTVSSGRNGAGGDPFRQPPRTVSPERVQQPLSSVPTAANPARSESYHSVNTIGSNGANGGRGRLSISTISTGSYVHVPFPPVENKPQTATQPQSNSSTAGFDFSPLRKRVSSSESMEGKMSIAGTMRRTSRFFRKLGGVATGASKSTPSSPLPQGDFFPHSTESPPLPPLPSPLTRSPASRQNSSPRQNVVARDPRVNRRDIPQLPSTSHLPGSPTDSSSTAMLRDDSNNSLLSAQSRSSAGSGSRRRRSLSLNSVRIDGSGAEGGLAVPQQPERARRPSSRTEDDRLRRELRRWRLGVDGVLGAAGTSTTPSPSSFGGSPSLASQSSPQLERTASNLSADPRPPSPSLSLGAEQRRASVPGDTNKPLPSLAAYRSASLPTSSLAPQPPTTVAERPSSSEGDTPKIRLFSPSRSGSISSAVTVNPASLARGSLTRGSVSSITSTEDGTGIGLGLAAITETLHSRDSTLVSPAAQPATTPTRDTFPTVNDSPARLSPSSAPATVSNRSKGDRGSIVALGSSLPASLAASSVSLSSSMGPGGSRSKNRAAKAAEAAAEEAMTDEEVEEKARVLATRAWDEDETFLEKRKIAEWLGTAGRLRSAMLRLYIDHFDFAGLRLDLAFRKLCGKLYLKAETQQVDRILEQFSRRYFEDNPSSPYGSPDVVHAVSYSLLLLNTDLHVVDSTTRMSRQQFIRNTLEAINAQTGWPNPNVALATPPVLVDTPPALPDASAFDGSSARPSTAETVTGGADSLAAKDSPAPASIPLPASPASSRPATANSLDRSTKTVINVPHRSESAATVNSTQSNRTPYASMQTVLKDMYNAIRAQPIYQTSVDSASHLNLPEHGGRPSFSLAPSNSPYATWSGGVNRSASRRSSQSTISGVSSMAYKRSSIRGIGSFLGASSLELVRSSSPTSSATSLSDERWNTAYGLPSQHHAVPTIGFANSLSNTIIREQREDDNASEASTIEVTDEELALLGAPWAKEGLLQRKHYWEMTGKRAKDKSWSQVFVVISAGEVKMFRFDGSGGSMRGGAGVGGGDWTASASNAGSISLIHALCSSMPPPGYSRDRPPCFVLTMPNGGSYFFQAGTPDLVAEWVSTCNYWAARLSKEPLPGGVSNMEYGWNRVDRSNDDEDREEIASIRSGHSRISYAGSAFHSATSTTNGNDRIHINEWKAPEVPLVPSNLPEEAQLEALKRHATLLRKELLEHNTIRTSMLRLYSPRSSNASKAQANWERKSKHLLAENVKYNTYIDALSSAIKLRALQRGKKEVEAMLESADADADDEDELIASLSPSDGPTSPAVTATSTPPSPEITFSPAVSEPVPEPASRRQSRYDSASQTSVATSRTEFFDSHGDSPPPSTP